MRQTVSRSGMHHDGNFGALRKDALVRHCNGLDIESADENIAKLSRIAYGAGFFCPEMLNCWR
jgi:hypothetical protein